MFVVYKSNHPEAAIPRAKGLAEQSLPLIGGLMQSALYYPFTSPERMEFLKTALFLWDTVDFIVPWRDFLTQGRPCLERDALEIVARPYVPTDKDKKAAHDEFEKICRRDNPTRLKFALDKGEENYSFFPQKLLPETWDLLRDSELAQVMRSADGVSNASTSPLFGYYMMSVLASCCANGRKPLVTDNQAPYTALAKLLSDDAVQTPPDDWVGRLVAVSLKGPNFTDIPLSKLVELRSKEDQMMKAMRHKFLKEVTQSAAQISQNCENPNVVREIIEDYTKEMELDLKELKRALRSSGRILARESAVSLILCIAAQAAIPVSAGLSLAPSVTLFGAAAKGLKDFSDRRRKLLGEHPSSWLMATHGPRMPFY